MENLTFPLFAVITLTVMVVGSCVGSFGKSKLGLWLIVLSGLSFLTGLIVKMIQINLELGIYTAVGLVILFVLIWTWSKKRR